MNSVQKITGMIVGLIFFTSCSNKTDPKEYFENEQQKKNELSLIAPYVLKMPERTDQTAWYESDSMKALHQKLLNHNKAEIQAYYIDPKDSVRFYLVNMRDWSSLHERYKLYGGMYVKKNGAIDSLTELFITPRLQKEEVEEKGKKLFDQIISERNIGPFYENKEYVEWPYKGLLYDVKKKQWIMTPENEMYFLEQVEDSVKIANLKRTEEMKDSTRRANSIQNIR
ncbi:MAG: hypothetical protein K0R51_684 [Cytophagaceae bacterium]|jgi:hypothetical protein|nr:hypothetical protein [Cytophagaceae bacterium]